MRVLFLGATGTQKDEAIAKIAREARKERGVPQDPKDPIGRQYVDEISLDEELKAANTWTTIKPFLDDLDSSGRSRVWREVFQKRILNRIAESKPNHVFLSIHAVLYRDNNFFTCIDESLLAEFSPSVIVTFIDDVYDIMHRVNVKREKVLRTRTTITLPEALSWRSAEIMVGDLIARGLYINPENIDHMSEIPEALKSRFSAPIPHFVVAVKHPTEMAYRLLFKRDLLRIYASYPISDTRGKQDRVDEIDKFRSELASKYTVFDPSTIDELRTIDSRLQPRWDLRSPSSMVSERRDYAAKVKNMLKKYEQVIRDQTEERDYRLVDQSNIVCAYRPFFANRMHAAQGVEKELVHAINKPMEVYVVDPKEDQGNRKKRVFKTIERAISHTSLPEMLRGLEEVQQKHHEMHEKGGTALTWERKS